jgi:hypothetical protein
MQLPQNVRRPQFSIRALLVATMLVSMFFWSAPHIQDAREAWRRSQNHFELGPRIYGFHGAQCDPCRRKMVRAICEEDQPSVARVAWIANLTRRAEKDDIVQEWLARASASPTPEVATAARSALLGASPND